MEIYAYGEKERNLKHVPVLLDEVLRFIDQPGVETVVDATVGGGGHAEALLERMKSLKTLIGLDRDQEAVERARQRLKPFGRRVIVEKGNFADIDKALDRMKIDKVNAIIMDLGVSSFHFDLPDRGFSFRLKGPLDMRMDLSQKLTAWDLVNKSTQSDLAAIFKKFGEERRAKRIANAIVRERSVKPIDDTLALARIVEKVSPRKSGKSVHPATKVFQALRIAVNDELGQLEEALDKAVGRLAEGGRIAVISFHSLEDRIVKQSFVDMTSRCICPKELPACVCGWPGKVRLVTKKPVTPGKDEIKRNPRSRSAKLRVAERLAA
ncbi:16S rRNA (cytosine(1402)-N(4))-methyltransferase [hydrothermal vent metagenome]|uniref:16S rRNA (Cytosine(1402)-N(4))-methyltransferase n=1 Tax=hydrothermal vent metagenome TaxID=652676 RepID=A0A3B1BIA6_9ZZZZ